MKRERIKAEEPIFLGVDFRDIDVVKITVETIYSGGNGSWYVKTRDGTWSRLEYANQAERDALAKELKHLVRAFERTLK